MGAVQEFLRSRASGDLLPWGAQVAIIGCGGLGGYVLEELSSTWNSRRAHMSATSRQWGNIGLFGAPLTSVPPIVSRWIRGILDAKIHYGNGGES